MRKMANVEYYKASGICNGFDLLALFGLEFIAVSVLSLPYVALLCYLEWGVGRVLSLFFLFPATTWLNGWLGMVIVKHFKIRAPGLVYYLSLLAAILGFFCAWGGIWALGDSDTGILQFIGTVNHSVKNVDTQGFWWFFVLAWLSIATLPSIQAGRPFNATSHRWFKRKALKPFIVHSAFYNNFLKTMRSHVGFFHFFNEEGYHITSDFIFLSNFTLALGVFKIWLYYDRDCDICYITIGERYVRLLFITTVRNRAISRDQAKFLYHKLT